MATIESQAMVDQLIAANGHYEDDDPVMKIVAYTTQWGNPAWGLVYPWDNPLRYEQATACYNPQVIFTHTPHDWTVPVPGTDRTATVRCDPVHATAAERQAAAEQVWAWAKQLGLKVAAVHIPISAQDVPDER